MIGRMRAVTAALVGALSGAGWLTSIQPLGDVVCDGSGLGCALLVIVVGIPALFGGGYLLKALDVKIPSQSGIFVVALAAAAGYALAAVLTGRYGGWRDGAEHHGQDG
jgi:hypothetical protein